MREGEGKERERGWEGGRERERNRERGREKEREREGEREGGREGGREGEGYVHIFTYNICMYKIYMYVYVLTCVHVHVHKIVRKVHIQGISAYWIIIKMISQSTMITLHWRLFQSAYIQTYCTCTCIYMYVNVYTVYIQLCTIGIVSDVLT